MTPDQHAAQISKNIINALMCDLALAMADRDAIAAELAALKAEVAAKTTPHPNEIPPSGTP